MYRIKKIFTHRYFLLGIFVFVGLFIRLTCINKISGLWGDEVLVYQYATKGAPFGIIKYLWNNDFHMPLYYYFMWAWIKIFGAAEINLRLSSVIWGVGAIPAAYYLGKEYKSDKFGYLFASIICLSPILIYYSQEVRFYSMLIFFSILSTTYFLKLLKNPDAKNFLIFFVSNWIILYIYTMGIIFVFPMLAILAFHYYKEKSPVIKKYINYFGIFFITTIPYLILFLSYMIASAKTLSGSFSFYTNSHWWPFIILNDWFSTILKGIYIHNTDYYLTYFKSNYLLMILFFKSFISILFIFGLIVSLFKIDKIKAYLFGIVIFFMGVQAFLSVVTDFLLLTRYTLVILPIVLLLALSGIVSLKYKILRNIILVFIIGVFSYNSFFNYQKAVSFANRRGIDILVDFIDNEELPGDIILYPSKGELLNGYIDDSQLIDFCYAKALNTDKTKIEARKIFDDKFVDTVSHKSSFSAFKPYLLSDKPSAKMQNFMNSYIRNLPVGSRILLISGDYDNGIYYESIINVLINNEGSIPKNQYNNLLSGALINKIFIDFQKAIMANSSMHFVKKIKQNEYKHYYVKEYEMYIYEKK